MVSFAMSPSPQAESIVQAPHLFGESCCVSETAAECLSPPVAAHSEYKSFQMPSQPAETCPVKDELEGFVDKHYEEMVHLAASLTKANEDTLFSMDSKGLVEVLFETIEEDCRKKYGVPIHVKNLYVYLYNKGYRNLALEPLQCNEPMED